MIESRQVAFFRAKLLRTGGTSSVATLAVGVLAGSLPQIFSSLQNLGIPSSPSDCTLALYLPDVRSGELARKTASPAGEAQSSFTRGKRIRTQTFQHFRTMKGTEQFKVAIKNYLDKRAQEDALFRSKYETTTRTIDDVVTYILNEVKASGCNGFDDDEIYSMAVSTSLTSRHLKSASLSTAMWW